jgi:LmbE family N-acetylglucosaminyl deacetylase
MRAHPASLRRPRVHDKRKRLPIGSRTSSMRLALVLALAGLLAFDAEARRRAVRSTGAIPTPASMMWIAAHPDDEAVAAPLLAEWCIDDGADCTFLVLTRGEAGPCLLPGGCLPDLRSVRAGEAGAGAELFRASSILLRYPDGGGVARPVWEGDVAARIAALIEAVHPALILTFDPRHGTTCHPDHRETGRLVTEAMQRLSYAPELLFLESRVTVAGDPLAIHFSAAAAAASRYDAGATWDAIAEDMRRHPSQFDARWIAAIEAVPPGERALFIAEAETVLTEPLEPCSATP